MSQEFIDVIRVVITSRTKSRVRSRSRPAVARWSGVPLFLTQMSETLRLEATSPSLSGDAIGAAAARHGGDLRRSDFMVSQVGP